MPKMSEVKTGDILLFRSNNIYSWLIQLRTLSRFSHIGFAIWLRDELWVIEAKDWYVVQAYPLRKYLEDPKKEVFHFELLEDVYGIDREKVVDCAWRLCGERYASPWQFIRSWGFFTRRICDWFGIPQDIDPNGYHCSETVMRCLRHAGYMGEGLREPSRTSPGDIALLPCLHGKGKLTLDETPKKHCC